MNEDFLRKWFPWIVVAVVALIVLAAIALSGGGDPADCIRQNGDWYCR